MRDAMHTHTQAIEELAALLGDRLVTSAADVELNGQNETY